MIHIGYINKTYAELRNILNVCKHVKYVDLRSKNDIEAEILNSFVYKKTSSCFDDRICWFKKIGFEKEIDFIHTFNTICYTKHNWISTFESMLPRVVGKYDGIIEKQYRKNLIKQGIEALKKDNCIKLIALSQNAADIQKEYLDNNTNNYKSIINKTCVLHPPQRTLINYNDLNFKFSDIQKEIRFLFVGDAFWCKGGAVVCKILSEFRRYYPIKITIVSGFINQGEHGINILKEEKIKLMKWLKQNESWVICYKNLPNKKVLNLAKQSHVGLLPSYHETYGYSLLELQAAGCPVISTDVRAFPEINNEDCGWICRINKNLSKVSYKDTMNEEILGTELRKVLEGVLNNINQIPQKGEKALIRIEKKHSPIDVGNRLYEIYRKVY